MDKLIVDNENWMEYDEVEMYDHTKWECLERNDKVDSM